MTPIVVNERVVIPVSAITMHAVRASGPGGQNVNKVASKVELRVETSKITGLDDFARSRLSATLLVTSQRTRDQSLNLEDAREKIRLLVLAALVRPKKRFKTKRTRGSQERRLDEKKRHSRTKRERRGRFD